MKKIILIIGFLFPLFLLAQPVADTISIRKLNDTTYRIRRTLIFADSSDQSLGSVIAKSEAEVVNYCVNSVLEISRPYSYKLLEVLSGLPFKSILNRYNELERILPDSSLFISLNKLFPLEEGTYELFNNITKEKTNWKISFNKKDNYFYVIEDNKVLPIFITSELHFRVEGVSDFFKIESGTWLSLTGQTLKKIK